MKEPASDSLTDQVPHEAVAVPNGGSALHGSHPLLAEAIWMKKNKITTTRACACHILCSFMPFAFKKTWLFAKLQVQCPTTKKKKALFFASHRLLPTAMHAYDALLQSPALARLCSPSF